jgi:hypothetical protein
VQRTAATKMTTPMPPGPDGAVRTISPSKRQLQPDGGPRTSRQTTSPEKREGLAPPTRGRAAATSIGGGTSAAGTGGGAAAAKPEKDVGRGEPTSREGLRPTAGNSQRAQSTSLAGRGLKWHAKARSRGRRRDDEREADATQQGLPQRMVSYKVFGGLRQATSGGEDG